MTDQEYEKMLARYLEEKKAQSAQKLIESANLIATFTAMAASKDSGIIEPDDESDEQGLGPIDLDSLVRLTDLDSVATEIESFLREHAPRYRMGISRTQNAWVRMNHCEHCGAKLGDFLLHSEPGGAFFRPQTKKQQILFMY